LAVENVADDVGEIVEVPFKRGLKASSQCGVLMKYSSDLVGATSSMRRGMTANPRLTARSTSRLICCDVFAWEENTSTNTRA
jgi:hypothetical protein